ncbi:phage tail domain-containing protein [Streptacidiphilus sp. P02-A3a]|uniref:phage distal tail protein n=1 Tax=Streptacidiphilus sp. P02-A3a TaxID=2704468 RepID=UPI0015FBFFDD|nr:phage tail domain-containing protein [Streptacidiphilus sp. P02-A3a]QMU72135.1 hypothetical protein GXP74_31750 [Streptacidiphilus sp. P02-A3a]
MALDDLITQDGQMQWRGVLLGEGTPYAGVSLSGWDDLPDLDSSTVAMPSLSGAWPGALLASTRTLQWDFEVTADSLGQLPAVLDVLRQATTVRQSESWLAVQLAGCRRVMRGRVVRRALSADRAYTRGDPVGSLVWECSDPRRYDPMAQSVATTLPTPEPGIDWGTDGSEAVQMLAPAQAAGLGSTASNWYNQQGGTMSLGSGGALYYTVGAASITAPAQLVWANSAVPSPNRFPIAPGQTAQFVAYSGVGATGAQLLLLWLDSTGTFISSTVGDGVSVTGTAPPTAAYARPVMQWAAVPSPARVLVGRTALFVSAPLASGLVDPYDWGTPGASGDMTAWNFGDAPAHPVITITGPVTMPSVRNVATGERLEYNVPLSADDSLVIDTYAGTVTLNGTASRLYAATTRSVPEAGFTLTPGATSLAFRGTGVGGVGTTASASLTWRSAYW